MKTRRDWTLLAAAILLIGAVVCVLLALLGIGP
jgi:hypothetical protein